MNVVLVLGGARSGRSRIAQDLAEAQAEPLILVATTAILDTEADRLIASRPIAVNDGTLPRCRFGALIQNALPADTELTFLE